jgi:hypothetical protein
VEEGAARGGNALGRLAAGWIHGMLRSIYHPLLLKMPHLAATTRKIPFTPMIFGQNPDGDLDVSISFLHEQRK